MNKTEIITKNDDSRLSILLMFVLIFIAYSNTLTSSWHLDDVINILWNTPLHLNNISLSALTKTFFANPKQPGIFYRPISCLTLALNWFFGQDATIGFHLVNITIHLLTSFFLYKTILLLLNSPRLKGRYQDKEQCIAILATIFWATNPVQTQAVTYIIQRMASMSALFYLLALYFYLNGRSTAVNRREKVFYYFLMALSFLFALGSKENSIVFPFSVFLVEIIFFNNSRITPRNTLYFIIGVGTLAGLTAMLTTDGNILQIFSSYQNRNFTLWQRLLTESRVVCWYLSLLFYPVVNRLSIEHDIQLSTSLFMPATTLPSIIFLITLCISALWWYKKFPIPAYAILFFLLNHIIESTILPLELVFEHRNYLPSLFLFWPMAVLIVQLIGKYKKRPVMHGILLAFVSILMSSLAMGTYIRNQVWYSEKSLWTDAVNKSPNSMRALLNLAYTYDYESDPKTAFLLNQKALGKASPTRNKFTVNAYNNMGNIMRKMGRNEDALFWLTKGLIIDDSNKDVLFSIFLLVQLADCRQVEAKKTMIKLLQQDPQNSRYLLYYGNVKMQDGHPEKGMSTLRKALQFSSASDATSWQILLSLSLASNKIHQFDKALFYIHLATIRDAPAFLVNLYALENHILSNNPDFSDQRLKLILSNAPLSQLRKKIMHGLDNPADIALDKNLILDYIDNWVKN